MKKLNCVLLIDDDPISSFVNKKLLGKMNITANVLTAANGEVGLNILKQQTELGLYPELILLDINMPVMGGIDFLENFQQLNIKNKESIKIIVLTTSNHLRDKALLDKLPTNDFLNKPLTAPKLIKVLEVHFGFDASSIIDS